MKKMPGIITSKSGSLAYHDKNGPGRAVPAFSMTGTFRKPLSCSFARLSAFAANGNHAPSDPNDAVCWDQGRALLFRIVGSGRPHRLH